MHLSSRHRKRSHLLLAICLVWAFGAALALHRDAGDALRTLMRSSEPESDPRLASCAVLDLPADDEPGRRLRRLYYDAYRKRLDDDPATEVKVWDAIELLVDRETRTRGERLRFGDAVHEAIKSCAKVHSRQARIRALRDDAKSVLARTLLMVVVLPVVLCVTGLALLAGVARRSARHG